MTGPLASEPVLAVKDLTVSFLTEDGARPVVHGISFAVGARETVAIVGESGSGKSVTALAVMRLLAEDDARIGGAVHFGGRDLAQLPEEAMQRIRGNEIAMIFQEPMTSLNPVMTIGDQIGEALITHRGLSAAEARQEAVALLRKVRIPDAAARVDEFPHRLSGGMRQRVMIAMALACRPKLLIADEPTTALDVTIQAEILALLRTLQDEEGMALVFITHDMGVVAEIADRTIVMLEGKIVEQDETATLFAAPRHPYTRMLLAAVPRLGSMQGQAQPMRFPVVDRTTGLSEPPRISDPTVADGAENVLAVENLSVRFDVRAGVFGRLSGRVHAVENVSFSIRPGETLALVGESGCGKSTTGRAILRLVEPQAGVIHIKGREVGAVSRADLRQLRRNAQMIFQDPFASLDPRCTVGFSISEPLLLHGLCDRRAARDRAMTLLRQVGLSPDMAGRYPHEFSGGQRQRVCIARALALEPALIVADESVSALDVSVKAQIVNLLLDLQADLGVSYLFISHDIAVVERVSHRVAVMYLGEIVEIGPRERIFGDPRHPYTQRLLSAVPVPDPARRGHLRVTGGREIKSPLRPVRFVPPKRQWLTVSEGHQVQVWGEEWNDEAGPARLAS